MNAQHEKLESKGVKAYIAKKYMGNKEKGSKIIEKWKKQEKTEQKKEAKNDGYY